jgi:hypothetical protein
MPQCRWLAGLAGPPAVSIAHFPRCVIKTCEGGLTQVSRPSGIEKYAVSRNTCAEGGWAAGCAAANDTNAETGIISLFTLR